MGALPAHDVPMLTGVSLTNNEFDEWSEGDFSPHLEFGGYLLE